VMWSNPIKCGECGQIRSNAVNVVKFDHLHFFLWIWANLSALWSPLVGVFASGAPLVLSSFALVLGGVWTGGR